MFKNSLFLSLAPLSFPLFTLASQVTNPNEEPTHWGDGLWTLHCDEKICKAEVDKQIQELLDNLEADKFIIALTDKKNFRKDILQC